MSLRDPYEPYARRSNRSRTRRQHSEDLEFNPYSTTQIQPTSSQTNGKSYADKGRYRDDVQYDRTNNDGPSNRTFFDNGHSGSESRQRSPPELRRYRYDHHGGLWTKGGRWPSIGRLCCCTLMTGALFFILIILALVLWMRPPNIVVGGVDPLQRNGGTIQLVENGISANLGVNISVDNPNYFAVDFKRIEAQIFYPINNTQIGGGVARDVVFNAHSQRNWTFPFTINYTTTLDPSRQILADLAQRCGVLGGKRNLSVSYRITLALRILLITVSPVIKNSLSFECPIDPTDLENLIKSAGTNLGSL